MFQTVFKLSDTALSVLLQFIAMFFKTVSHKLKLNSDDFVLQIPHNIRAARKIASNGKSRDDFVQYICCPSCHSLYSKDDFIVNSTTSNKKCNYVKYPQHPQSQHRSACGEDLMKKVKSPNGKYFLQPKLVYCYKSVIESLKEMVRREGFVNACEEWRQNVAKPNTYEDVYNGNIWKDFSSYNGIPFLSASFNYALHLNVDWFNLFDRTQHSEGVIYLSIFNLPRKERFKQSNIILVGIIPGPKEPELHINSFLQPLVNDLKELWQGVQMLTSSNIPVVVRAALLCVGCDIPAARKVSGFLGHRATKGCSRCSLSFPTVHFGDKADYTNFNRETWEKRDNKSHRLVAIEHKNGATKSTKVAIEKLHGVRYSCLLELPYFDAPRMCIIDPMHNLLLGTAKHYVDVWKQKGLLSSETLLEIQKKVDSFCCPSDVGRIPSKIQSSFSGFTADQWRSWTVLFSLFCLKGVVPLQDYNCWLLFVKACYLFCRRSITLSELNDADNCIMEFCRKFATLYGKEQCTINMHLHGHLQECISDYGPVYSFWCFAFERMNGVLGSYHTNNHSISIQLARRFLDSKVYAIFKFVDEYAPLLAKFDNQKGSLKLDQSNSIIQPLPPTTELSFTSTQQQQLKSLLEAELPSTDFDVLMLHNETKSVLIGEYVYGACGSRHSHSSFVLAKTNENSPLQLAMIHAFIQCIVVKRENLEKLKKWFAIASFFEPHQCHVWFGYPTEVWNAVSFQEKVYVPIVNIKCRVVCTKTIYTFGSVIGEDSVYITSPVY